MITRYFRLGNNARQWYYRWKCMSISWWFNTLSFILIFNWYLVNREYTLIRTRGIYILLSSVDLTEKYISINARNTLLEIRETSWTRISVLTYREWISFLSIIIIPHLYHPIWRNTMQQFQCTMRCSLPLCNSVMWFCRR